MQGTCQGLMLVVASGVESRVMPGVDVEVVWYVQGYWYANEPLFGWCILCTVVDLLPEGEFVVGAGVKVVSEWDAHHPVEHKV